MDKLLKRLMMIWDKLDDDDRKAVIDYARLLLVNQEIEKNRGVESEKV